MSDNLIFDYMQVLIDGGGVYNQGIAGTSLGNGQKVTGNVIHDQLAWGRALQSDDGSTFITYSRNVLYNDTYDWGSNHFDYRTNGRNYDPLLIANNYWQQGDPDWSVKHVTESRNTIITGPSQAPSSIVQGAGIEPRYRSILAWQPAGESVPNAPERVSVLYAFRGKAYVTWRPSFAAGSDPVTAYVTYVCRMHGLAASSCRRGASTSAADFARLGYAIVPGLAAGGRYTFVVTSSSNGGISTPSIASAAISLAAGGPRRPGRPRNLSVRAGRGSARLIWYAPATAGAQPILGYRVTSSAGGTYDVGGLDRLIISNAGGRVVEGHRSTCRRARVQVCCVGYNACRSRPHIVVGINQARQVIWREVDLTC